MKPWINLMIQMHNSFIHHRCRLIKHLITPGKFIFVTCSIDNCRPLMKFAWKYNAGPIAIICSAVGLQTEVSAGNRSSRKHWHPADAFTPS
jgi:hypothetical protein